MRSSSMKLRKAQNINSSFTHFFKTDAAYCAMVMVQQTQYGKMVVQHTITYALKNRVRMIKV